MAIRAWGVAKKCLSGRSWPTFKCTRLDNWNKGKLDLYQQVFEKVYWVEKYHDIPVLLLQCIFMLRQVTLNFHGRGEDCDDSFRSWTFFFRGKNQRAGSEPESCFQTSRLKAEIIPHLPREVLVRELRDADVSEHGKPVPHVVVVLLLFHPPIYCILSIYHIYNIFSTPLNRQTLPKMLSGKVPLMILATG